MHHNSIVHAEPFTICFITYIVNTTPACFACFCINEGWSIVNVNTTLLSKDNYELTRQNYQQTVFPVKNFIGINDNLLLREKTFRFSCERQHKHAVFAHSSPLLKANNLSQTAQLFQAKKATLHYFSSNGQGNKSRKKKSTLQNTIYLPVASSLVS